MKEHSFAVSVSLMFHIVIVALFLRVPFDQYIKPKIMVLDFTLEKERTTRGEYNDRELRTGKQGAENTRPIIKQENNAQKSSAMESLSNKNGLDAVVSDPSGPVIIVGNANHTGIEGGTAAERHTPSGKSSQFVRTSSGNGNAGTDEKNYAFIRDTIIRKIKYPERARENRWEGKILFSFVVLENGSIRDVKIVNSSGFRILDNSAKEVIEETIFTQKVPSGPVELPVEFKLQ